MVNTSTVKPLIGYMTGISFQYNFLPRFALHSEINYEKTGYSVRQDRDYEIWRCFGIFPYQTTIWLSSYTLPTSLKFIVIKGSKANLFIQGGTSLSVFNKESRKSEYDVEIDYPPTISKERFAAHGLIGLGTSFQLTRRFQITVEARDYLSTDKLESNTHSFRLLTGLSFKL
ncbi:MAG TPA: outer membrane beta-barrel protein [Bacteroidia bacterium]|nr:outer membrane beta-barrel protein [Bacteroidia bacterium]HRG52385.1 outer membrane beta-barrel protein [Bacteroidia bacterium]